MTVNQMTTRARPSLGVPTRWLLLAGLVGPVLFVVTFVVAGALRPGYDPVRHFVSLLSLGDGGWVQVVNFVIGGLLIAGFGLGLRRRWPATGLVRRVPQLVVLAGLALVACGAFTPDPALGYPAGAPAGIPMDASWHAGVHYVGAILVFVGLASAMVISARHAPVAGTRRWAAYSLVSAVVLLGGWIGGFVLVGPSGIVETAGLLQRVAIVAGWQWLVATALIELRRG